MARFENIELLTKMLRPKNIQWHIITDEGSNATIPKEDWIHHYICPNEGVNFWERCNNSINWFLDTSIIYANEMYCILNDDDAYEPNFFSKLDEICTQNPENSGVIICSMERGYNIPTSAMPERQHPTHKLWAHGDNIKVGSVGVEQIILSGTHISNHRLPLEIAGDGMFIVDVVSKNGGMLAPDVTVLFNYFEPERWIVV